MPVKTKRKIICSRGHVFYKSSDCPVCPKCWSGYYKKELGKGFPKKLGAPALRALLNANIKRLEQLANYTQKEIANLHGIGPNAIKTLKAALRQKKLSFKK